MRIHKNTATIITMQNLENDEKSLSTTFKSLMRETTVYKYYVELKEGVLTEEGYLDLVKVPDLRVAGVGQFLKNLRLKNCLRQKDIAEIFNGNSDCVKGWENNQNRMPLKTLVKIVETLGVSRNAIYLLIDQRKLNTKNNLPVKFERIRNIVQYFNPLKDDGKGRITLLRCCPKEALSNIKKILNVNTRSRGRDWKIITCRELYKFLKTFFRYIKVSKIHPPLTDEIKGWYNDGVDLKRAVIIPCLQRDGYSGQWNQYYRLSFHGNSKVLHDYFVDAIYYEYKELPSTYFGRCYFTEYCSDTINIEDVTNLAGNTKTSPAHRQTVKDYLKETQPHLDYLFTAPKAEQKIAIRIWASTEGCITVYKKNERANPRLVIACSHPDLAKQLQKILRRFNMNFNIRHSKRHWSGIDGLSTSSLSTCINFLKFGGFVKGVKIGATSKYHEGIDKDVLLLGILEFKKRELENIHLKKLPIQQIHHEINRIVNNIEYRSAGYYINYFS